MIETYIVDSFTNEPFKGNPAGVCLVDEALPEGLMLSIAQELGLSETAFVLKGATSDEFSIRFFSPKMEIPLCGHATQASAKVLFRKNPSCRAVTFVNIQGIRIATRKDGALIEMEFPVYSTIPQEAPKALLEALGLDTIVNSEYNKETRILLLEIEDNKLLRSLSPDFAALKRSHDTINGVLVTCPSDQENYDFESRYFWPWSGTNEDPVTGGTHTFLANYWSMRIGKAKMMSFQCSERSGFMEVEIVDGQTMKIRSQAQIVFKGTLEV